MEKKTHTVAKEPRLSISRLADYMAASEQGKRTIAQSCKYRPIARIVQHDEAKTIISNYLLKRKDNPDFLKEKATQIRHRMSDDDFEEELNQHNADYLNAFADVVEALSLPSAELLPPPRFSALVINGVKMSFQPSFLLQRVTRTNKVRTGALMLRYAKRKALSPNVADYQSALIFGYLRENSQEHGAEPERKLCLTLDAVTGSCYEAPTKSVYLFNEATAACATIAERWPNIPPPKNAVL